MLMILRLTSRAWGLFKVFFLYGLDEPLRSKSLMLRWLGSLARLFFPRKKRADSYGERLREALESLGPIFVKFGQAISTRRDMFPASVVDPLCQLQDHVAPFEGAQDYIEKLLGASTTELFQSFDPTPLASASVAQVHAAVLHDGREVVVKVIRPGIEKIIEEDLFFLRLAARWVHTWHPDGVRLRAREIVEEFAIALDDELDLVREAASASQLRRNFESGEILYVPWVYWPYIRKHVMVLERVYGVPIHRKEFFIEIGLDLKKLAERGVEIFFTQVFRDCFFHADMHPGNVLVDVRSPQNPRYIAIDFGIMGTLSPENQRYLAHNFMAFFNRDYRRVAKLHVDSGWVPRQTPINAFEAAVRTVCEPIFERPLSEISCAHLLVRLFQIARRFQMPLQPELILLQKTLLHVEGLGRMLYPELDLWKTAKPFLERWLRKQRSLRSVVEHFKQADPFFWECLPYLPRQLHEVLEQKREVRPQIGRPHDRVFLGSVSILVLVGWMTIAPSMPAWMGVLAGAATGVMAMRVFHRNAG